MNDALFLRELLSSAYPNSASPAAEIERAALLKHNLGTTPELSILFWKGIRNRENGIKEDPRMFDVSLGNVLRLILLRVSRETVAVPERLRPQDRPNPAADYYYFTGLGIEFLRACTPPRMSPK